METSTATSLVGSAHSPVSSYNEWDLLEEVIEVPKIFRGWELFHAPKPIIPDEHTLYMTSKWINMNILSLDVRRRGKPESYLLEGAAL